MIPRFQPQDFVLSPGLPIDAAVRHYAIGILVMEYPAKPDVKGLWADPEAIKRYGPDLYQTLENIYAEVQRSQRTATIRVTWNKGAPEVAVIKRQLIIIPGVGPN